ncbi:MAG: hypothetical protein IJF42_05590, partial [Clostridia bacterium]|nr:hypothetical protein [Clostridia bacterium]
MNGERKSLRLSSFNYNENGTYFVTVCTKEKQPFLCEIVGDGVLDVPPKTKMLAIGAIAEKYLRQMSAFYESVPVAKNVIMPNHIHF